MPIYLYWGEDEFAIARAADALRQRALEAAWADFNENLYSGSQPGDVIQALNQAMTPPFGAGGRFVQVADSEIGQRCPDNVLTELERTLSNVPETTTLLFTSISKPDARLKSTKLLQKYAEIREFSPIPPWKTDLIANQVRQIAKDVGVMLTPEAIELLVEAVGSNTRQLVNELEKLRLYQGETPKPIAASMVQALITTSTQTTLKLADAIRQGNTAIALELVVDLLRQNEPALQMVNSLVRRFRTWLWIALMLESGERNEQTIAQAAEIGNPKQLFFLKQDVKALTVGQLLQTLPILLELEASLKRGADELTTLQTKVIELCQVCQRSPVEMANIPKPRRS